MLRVIMLIVSIVSDAILSVVMQKVISLRVVRLIASMLNVTVLSVVMSLSPTV